MGSLSFCTDIMAAQDPATRELITQLLNVMPQEWKGTTFRNENLLGREQFAENLTHLIASKAPKDASPLTTAELEELGNAEDYLRVATNIATTLEVFLGRERGYSVDQVFTFSSVTMPVIAVVLTAGSTPVHLYVGAETSPFTPDQVELFSRLGATLEIHESAPVAQADAIVLGLEAVVNDASAVDGIMGKNVLYIVNKEKINPADILVIRKRMCTPVSTPNAQIMLEILAGQPARQPDQPEDSDALEFYNHLQTLSGTAPTTDVLPLICTAGLPTVCSLWMALIAQGGADILMASTAYGGSSQLTDLLTERAGILNKHTYDIQGVDADLGQRIHERLDRLAEKGDDLMPTTILFVEIPTNPDMKVPDVSHVAPMLKSYKEKTGRKVVLMVDTTFAPGSKVMKLFEGLDADLPVMAFISLSKSVSRGVTTSGALVPNHTEDARTLVRNATNMAGLLDTKAKPDQLLQLVQNHKGVEQRCDQAYRAADAIGHSLRQAVQLHMNYDMPLGFPTPQQASQGFTSSTFSFNLPPPQNATEEDKAALAQRFVDLLCAHKEFKPCVSFGQDNGLVYATVPATSTQGAIKEEDKAKQAVGGVQLVRLSFSPSIDGDAVAKIITDAVATIYA